MFAVVAAVAACTAPEESVLQPDDLLVPGVVTWITDGDTIDVETGDGVITVRLAEINAPDSEECFYEEALDHLIDTLRDSEVTLEVVGVDQFDRTLAHVFEGDRHVNLEMVSTGLAFATSPDEGDPYGIGFIDEEERAFAARTGLWGPTACGGSESAPVEIVPFESVSDPPGPDQDVLDEEFITIVNRADTVADLSRWTLRDESSRHRFTFPDGTAIGAGETIRVTSADPGWSPGGESVWNNDGDMALLQDPARNIVSRWRY